MGLQILLLGHPRFGSGYISKYFRAIGIDIGYYKYGKDGVSSWLIAPKENIFKTDGLTIDDKYFPFTRPNGFHLLCHVIRNPYTMIPSILDENQNKLSYKFRKKVIHHYFGIDLDSYNSMERACISFIYWNQLIESQSPTYTFRMETIEKDIQQFIQRFFHSSEFKIVASRLPSSNYNHVPHPSMNWDMVSDDTILKLDKFCLKYKYMRISRIIKRTTVQKLKISI